MATKTRLAEVLLPASEVDRLTHIRKSLTQEDYEQYARDLELMHANPVPWLQKRKEELIKLLEKKCAPSIRALIEGRLRSIEEELELEASLQRHQAEVISEEAASSEVELLALRELALQKGPTLGQRFSWRRQRVGVALGRRAQWFKEKISVFGRYYEKVLGIVEVIVFVLWLVSGFVPFLFMYDLLFAFVTMLLGSLVYLATVQLFYKLSHQRSGLGITIRTLTVLGMIWGCSYLCTQECVAPQSQWILAYRKGQDTRLIVDLRDKRFLMPVPQWWRGETLDWFDTSAFEQTLKVAPTPTRLKIGGLECAVEYFMQESHLPKIINEYHQPSDYVAAAQARVSNIINGVSHDASLADLRRVKTELLQNADNDLYHVGSVVITVQPPQPPLPEKITVE